MRVWPQLLRAAQAGQLGAVRRWLEEAGATERGATALHLAASFGRCMVAAELLAAQASVHRVDAAGA